MAAKELHEKVWGLIASAKVAVGPERRHMLTNEGDVSSTGRLGDTVPERVDRNPQQYVDGFRPSPAAINIGGCGQLSAKVS